MTHSVNQKIFLSYSWKDKDYVSKVDSALSSLGFDVSRDIRDLGHGKSIKEFMRTIRKSDYVVIVLSSNYLKSANCMFEVCELIKDSGYANRLFSIVTPDADIYSPFGRLNYVRHWQDTADSLKKDLESLHIENVGELALDLKRYKNIASNISEFLDMIADINNPSTANGIEVLSDMLLNVNNPSTTFQEEPQLKAPFEVKFTACHRAELYYVTHGNEYFRGKFGIKKIKDASELDNYDLPALECTVKNISDQFRIINEPVFHGEITMPAPSNKTYQSVSFITIPEKFRSLEPGGSVTFYDHGRIMLSIINALFDKKITQISVEDNFGFSVSVSEEEIRSAEQYFREFDSNLNVIASRIDKYSKI